MIMYEIIILVLVLYVFNSIVLRSAERRREIKRLQGKVAELQKVVSQIRGRETTQEDDLQGKLVELELQDILTRLDNYRAPQVESNPDDFEQSHYVEGEVSKSVVVGKSMPSKAESTL